MGASRLRVKVKSKERQPLLPQIFPICCNFNNLVWYLLIRPYGTIQSRQLRLRTLSFITWSPLSSDVQCNSICIDHYIRYITVPSIQRICLHSICNIIQCCTNKWILNSIWIVRYDIKEYPLCMWALLPTDTFCRTTPCNLDNTSEYFGRILALVFRLESWLNQCSLYVGVQLTEICLRSLAYLTRVILFFFL